MDFIADNYVWFIVGGIIILMAIIGYFADKTDFGRKVKTEKAEKNVDKIEKKKNKKDKKEKNKKPNKIEVDAKGIDELSKDVAEKNALIQSPNVLDQASFVPPSTDEIPTDNQQFSTPMANEVVDQSLFAPLTDQNDTLVNGSQEIQEPIADVSAVGEVVEEEPENPNDDQSKELKNIDPVTLPENDEENKQNNDVVAEEEDIWKF